MRFKVLIFVLVLSVISLLPSAGGLAQVTTLEPDPLDLPSLDDSPMVTPDVPETAIPEPTATPTPRPTRPGPPTTTSTPTPVVPEFVHRWTNEVIFPQAVYFNLVIDLPLDQISVLTLTINVEGEPPRVLERSALLEHVTLADPFTEVRYIWQAGVDPVLPLARDVEYRWEIVLVNGTQAIIPDAFVFNDPSVPWMVDADPENVLSFIYPQDVIDPVPLRPVLRTIYDQMVENTGIENPPVLNFALYNANTPLDPCSGNDAMLFAPQNGIDIPCDPPAAERILASMRYTPVRVTAARGFALQRNLVRLMVDAFYNPLWQRRDVPDWFRTGLAYLYYPDEKGELITMLRASGRVYLPYTLAQMAAYDPETMPLWEAQAYAMVLLMARESGIDAVFDLAVQAGAGGSTFGESYEALMGQPLEALLPYWRHWIYTDTALRDAQLDLYAGDTPIPPATLTATPFPPSPTSTSTDTPTVTPTPTVTGILTATPLPTLTATPTFTSAPPTNTPLPARARPTLTPTPVPVETGGSMQDIDDVIVAVLAGIIVISSAGIMWVLRSRRQQI